MLSILPIMRLFASAGTIDGRTKVQKIVYILQCMGFPFQERYRYHLHGPYSQGLTHKISHLVDLGLLTETSEERTEIKRFRYEATDALHEFLAEIGESVPTAPSGIDFHEVAAELNAQNSALLEVVATALFLYRSGKKLQDLASELQRLKPHLDKQIGPAMEYLEKLNERGWLELN